ncbi:hypothetical protein [Burkholderia lata]|uniref:hypothetical protein n=1 Tax=Burkholderia lata (strain ATCC 17760 / DSM 23089 / LMG 22485 / NCIMB 9086 / R18194 / 383) TaxID=482957 RepID=UPI00145412CB|nr:hypothetical protein [Burkholderia lata]VWB39299.1 hypothetical protein BLA15816_01766 [Burkholderia lata]
MNHDATPDSGHLPKGFEELEPFLAAWSTPTSHERWIRRAAMPYDEIVRFYDAMFARAEEATVYLEQFPLDDMPEPARNLFRLLLSLCHASVAVEMHQAPGIKHAPPGHALQIVMGFQPHG